MEVGDLIKRYRTMRGMSQRELSRRLFISPSYLHKLENKQRNVSSELLMKISLILNQPVEDFYPLAKPNKPFFSMDDNILIIGKEVFHLDKCSKEQIIELIWFYYDEC